MAPFRLTEKPPPPTDRQLRYIEVLGGDPSDAGSNREASDRINQLLLLRRVHWPLDPEILAERGAKAGAVASGGWQSAHQRLLAGLRLDLQEYVNLSLGNLQAKLSDPLGRGGSSQSQGPDELVRMAEGELQRLELYQKWGQPLDALPSPGGGHAFSEQNQQHETETISAAAHLQHEESKADWMPWLWLIAVFAVCVTVEAGLNIGLLMGGLEGGGLEAFLLAVLTSMINVGGLGIAAGYFLYTLRRRVVAATPWLYQTAWGIWGAFALGFNLLAGRHRQSYARVTQAKEADPNSNLTAGEVLPEISFNPFTWELPALLFALLGIILCAVACAKGLAFARDRAGDSGTDALPRQDDSHHEKNVFSPVDIGGGAEVVAPRDVQLFGAFASLPQRYRDKLTKELRERVADWYRALDEERRNVKTLLDALNEQENAQACIDIVEQAFIAGHNGASPQKIDIQKVVAHRQDKYPNLLPSVTDSGVLDEAVDLVDEWGQSGQSEFDKRIAEAQDKITQMWKDYQPLVLGPLPSETPQSR